MANDSVVTYGLIGTLLPMASMMPPTIDTKPNVMLNAVTVRGEDGEYVDFRHYLNGESLSAVTAYVEDAVLKAEPESRFQFERLGYFVTDRHDHQQGAKAVFNRTVGLKDSWSK